jgi:integrase
MNELPTVDTIRNRINKAHPKQAKYCLMTAYLYCGRVSEVISKICPSDKTKTTARGPTGNDVKIRTYQKGQTKEEAAVFTVRTAKRQGKERQVALPLNPQYEQWTQELYDYFKQFGNSPVFPITRQKAYSYAKKVFAGLKYQIEYYKVYEDGKIKQEPPIHTKGFRTHALRHLRATELLNEYDFNGVELSAYGGWTLRSTIGVGSAVGRYAHLNWKKYFPKLLIRREW